MEVLDMRAEDWRALGFGLLVVSFTACDAADVTGPTDVSSTSTTTVTGTTTPTNLTRSKDHPFFQGVYLGDANTTPERVAGALADFSTMVGQKPSLVKSFHDLDADFSANGWAGRLLREIDRASATNYIALDLNWSGRSGSLLDAINSGAADAALARTAQNISGVGSTVLVELAWEMNGNWNYAWQGVSNGADQDAPAKYAAAWRHVVNVFRAQGATNVRWVFNPNTGNSVAAGSPRGSSWNWWKNYYPGDAYVDYVGGHGYNGPQTFGTSYHDFNSLFFGADSDNMIADMMSQLPNKPIILGEIGMEENANKGAWIRDAYTRMLQDPRIAGAVWFNMNKEADWRIESDATSLAAYRSVMSTTAVAATFSETAGMAVATR
jgi:endoglucanase